MTRAYAFLSILACLVFGRTHSASQMNTVVSIRGEDFFINNEITLKGRMVDGISLEGLLPNARMVQGIFDDLNPETRHLWKYPDTGEWSPDRNTAEFVAAMPEWHRRGLLAFTLNIQGGSPTGYGNKGWVNPGYYSNGNPRPDYFQRLEGILRQADRIGMVVILGLFYFGQDQHLENESAVINAVNSTVDWIFAKKLRNVLIEINNECNSASYDHAILKPARVHELIELVKGKKNSGYRLYAGTSYTGGRIPFPNVVMTSDFLLLHGNGVDDPGRITEMVKFTREVEGYRPMPILFNEDDHYDFDRSTNNMMNAFRAGASWGFFDLRKRGETLGAGDSTFREGYQSIPVSWGITSQRKEQFFELLARLSGPGPYVNLTSPVVSSTSDSSSIIWNLENVSSIGGYPVTLAGNPIVREFDLGKAVEFDGIDDGLIVQGCPLNGSTSFTMEIVCKPYESFPNNVEQRFLHVQNPGRGNRRALIELRLTDANTWFVDTHIRADSAALTLLAKHLPHPLGPWYHIALAYENGVGTHYVNGVEEMSGRVPYIPVENAHVSIGMRMNKVWYFKGAIRSVGMTRRALRPGEFKLFVPAPQSRQ